MKIVQTYWSKPIFEKSGDLYNRIQGGWPSLKSALCAVVYSCLSLKRFYPNIELVTDNNGYQLLIDELGLPYSKVNLALNEFDVDPNLWALAKIYSYGLQEEPFIHVDNDVFIWEKFPERIENAPICCQNYESITKDYQDGLRIIKRCSSKSSSFFHRLASNCDLTRFHALNAGILGGNNVDFIKYYSQYSLDFFNSRKNQFSRVGEGLGLLNIVLEQLCLGYLAQRDNIRVECLKDIKDFDELINTIIDIYSAPIQTKYVHCLGDIKKDFGISQQIEFHLRNEYPEYYQRVILYCADKGYDVGFNSEDFQNFKYTNNLISCFADAESLLREVSFCLHPNLMIIMKDNKPYLRSKSNDLPISGWGKTMLYMNGYMTGDQIVEELFADIKFYFPKAVVRENVFFYLLHALYLGYVIAKPSKNL